MQQLGRIGPHGQAAQLPPGGAIAERSPPRFAVPRPYDVAQVCDALERVGVFGRVALLGAQILGGIALDRLARRRVIGGFRRDPNLEALDPARQEREGGIAGCVEHRDAFRQGGRQP